MLGIYLVTVSWWPGQEVLIAESEEMMLEAQREDTCVQLLGWAVLSEQPRVVLDSACDEQEEN